MVITPVANCKWCEMGECWTHGQIEKKGKGNGKGKGAAQWGGNKGAGKGGGKMGALMGALQSMLGGAPAAGAGAGNAPTTENIKGELMSAVQKTLGKGQVISKDHITYEVNEVAVDGNKKPHYQGSVTIAGGNTHIGEVAESKRGAEHQAAKVALAEAFPDHQPKNQNQAWGWGQLQALAAAAPQGPQGTKRGAAAMTHELTPKTQLVAGVQLLVQRPLTKEDIVWQIEAVPNQAGKYVGSCTIGATGVTYTTERPAASKKDAENDAAKVALKALDAQIAPLREEQKAKKAKKNAEGLAKLKEQTLAKKAAKAALATA